jgi:hypothetical protein
MGDARERRRGPMLIFWAGYDDTDIVGSNLGRFGPSKRPQEAIDVGYNR